jgi:hypothetical protein
VGDARIDGGSRKGDGSGGPLTGNKDSIGQLSVHLVHGVEDTTDVQDPLSQKGAADPQPPLCRVVIGRSADLVTGPG